MFSQRWGLKPFKLASVYYKPKLNKIPSLVVDGGLFRIRSKPWRKEARLNEYQQQQKKTKYTWTQHGARRAYITEWSHDTWQTLNLEPNPTNKTAYVPRKQAIWCETTKYTLKKPRDKPRLPSKTKQQVRKQGKLLQQPWKQNKKNDPEQTNYHNNDLTIHNTRLNKNKKK